jgi:hypothetical protein
MALSDERIKRITETLHVRDRISRYHSRVWEWGAHTPSTPNVQGMLIVKLFCWEDHMKDQIDQVRAQEVSLLKKLANLNACMMFLMYANALASPHLTTEGAHQWARACGAAGCRC